MPTSVHTIAKEEIGSRTNEDKQGQILGQHQEKQGWEDKPENELSEIEEENQKSGI